MGRGFACGDGWEGIIRRLAEKLEPLAVDGLRATQVKEKFGTLRFLLARSGREPPDDLSRMIHEAEKESQRTCEECSAPGTMQRITGRRWWTLCDPCADRESDGKRREERLRPE
jgi:hypothetical protein